MSIISIITDPGAGGTFLTWTLHYLAGHDFHFNTQTSSWEKIPDNPIEGQTAHVFRANQYGKKNEIYHCIDQLNNTKTDKFHSIYFHNLRITNKDQLGFSLDTQLAVAKAQNHTNKIIVLSNQQKNYLCTVSLNGRKLTHKFAEPHLRNNSFDEQHEDFINYFFKESLTFWNQKELINVWDRREFLALNVSPFLSVSILPYIDRTLTNYELDCVELYTIFDSTVDNLFNYLDIKINQERKKSWLLVYNEWKKIHHDKLNFLWYFDKIIESVLNGYYIDLARFNLDLLQEACIQHELIYKHNLNLKTWKLDKFNNTQQLHRLLEKNQHPININSGLYSPTTL
jgi:hypothetical protein